MAANRQKKNNNQPKTGGRNGGDYGGETRRAGGVGKRDSIVFWRGGSIGEVENYKLIVEFSKYFFLGQFILFS